MSTTKLFRDLISFILFIMFMIIYAYVIGIIFSLESVFNSEFKSLETFAQVMIISFTIPLLHKANVAIRETLYVLFNLTTYWDNESN